MQNNELFSVVMFNEEYFVFSEEYLRCLHLKMILSALCSSRR